MARPGVESTKQVFGAKTRENVETGVSNRHLTVDFGELELTDQLRQARQTGSLDRETFLQLCAEQPDALFNSLYNHLSKLQDQTRKTAEQDLNNNDDDDLREAQEEEITQLKERVKHQQDAIAELIQERDEARNQLEQHRHEESIAPASNSKKSTKLPDRQHLTDRINPKFKSWLIDVENKLEANADHYPTPLARMQYVKSMYKGEATNHLLPQFHKDSPQQYHDIDNIIDHLKTLYIDENQVINTKGQLRHLFIKDSKFQTFLSQFALYAQESELAPTL